MYRISLPNNFPMRLLQIKNNIDSWSDIIDIETVTITDIAIRYKKSK